MLAGSQRKGTAMGLPIAVCARVCVSVALIIFWAAQARMSLAAAAGAPVGGTLPSFAADKVRVAFSAVSPSQGVLWVAEVGGLLTKNGLSAEIIYTHAAIATLVAGEGGFVQTTGSPPV